MHNMTISTNKYAKLSSNSLV